MPCGRRPQRTGRGARGEKRAASGRVARRVRAIRSRMFQWESRVVAELFDAESLLGVLPYMCKIESESARLQHDPITSAVAAFLKCPLQLSLTEVGVMPFAGRAALVYPYNLMTERQKQFLRDCLALTDEWNVYNDTVVFKRSKEPVMLPPGEVLIAACQKIYESRVHEDPRVRVGVCNVVLQRVQGHIAIDKPVQRELNAWLQGRLEAGASTPCTI